MKEITERIDLDFDNRFEDIDVGSNDKSEPNSVSFKQILDSFEESKEQY